MVNALRTLVKLKAPWNVEQKTQVLAWLDAAEDFGKEFDEISDKVIEEQEARDLLSAINCYLLCDFGVQDVEMQAQAAAEKERILKIQEKLKRIIGE
ncbi:MAG: hypothetical protein J6W16_06855 [Methanobrevibacter sp.]|nr:hypothetical protein [Methanobrevibacter sp.]MBP5785283.1 hypothetical protein [Methanobrevibacter sp.]